MQEITVQKALTDFMNLSAGRQAVLIGAAAMILAVLFLLVRMATQPSLSLLYSGLDPAAAGDIVQTLEAEGATYSVTGEAIYVEAQRRDELRLLLAGQGKPALGPQGYELLDTLSGFGTTSQMFDAAYWRAKEGELARTIMGSPQIQSARVHISNAGRRPFDRQGVVTASVTLMPMLAALSPDQSRALQFLVASAVSGLQPEDVSIIDGQTGRLMSGPLVADSGQGDSDLADRLKDRVQRLLEARVGPGNVVVEVSVEHVTEREQIVERSFDPDSRVAISTDTEERGSTASDARPGAVTVASNLPEGDAGQGDGRSQSQNTETRERINYEVSETQRELLRAPGGIKRLSVAVLVDGLRTLDAEGQASWTARSEAELETLRGLVGAAVGLSEERGDTLTLQSLQFEPLLIEGTTAETANLSLFFSQNLMQLIQIAVLGAVALILGLFVVRPILARPPAPAVPRQLPAAEPAMIAGESPRTPQIDVLPPPEASTSDQESAQLDDLGFDFSTSGFDDGASGPEDPVTRLKSLIEDRQDESVEIIRSWMEGREEPA